MVNQVTVNSISAPGQLATAGAAASSASPTPSSTPSSSSASTANNSSGFFGKDGPSFGDLLDTINPLHHIPIVSTIYENLTGDTQSTAAKLAGGALFGGPIGFVANLADAVFQQATGKDVGDTMYAAIAGDDSVQVASNDAVPTATSATSAAQTQQVAMLDNAQAHQASTSNSTSRDQAILDLYGTSAPSAHQAYQKAQFRPYLNSVTHSQTV